MTLGENRIVFMGTPEFAVPVLAHLCDKGFTVVGVVTQPDRPTGRKRVLTPPPIKLEALRQNLPVLQPEKVRSSDALAKIAEWSPDVIVTCAYGQLLPQSLLDLPSRGSLNVHASLLPRWRGAAPIQRAIMAGDEVTGVAIMEMVRALDAGPVYGMRKVPILIEDHFGLVHDKLSLAGAELLLELLPSYLDGSLKGTAQTEEEVTYAHRIDREDEWISWNRHRLAIHNHIRGLNPWPGAAARLGDDVLKVWSSEWTSDSPVDVGTPGTVSVLQDSVWVACLDGAVRILEVQPAGKKRMAARDWVRGLKTGAIQFHVDEGRQE